MLLTRCPDCHTTFRVTADVLTKADGQVRCGRCAAVFNAFAELREGPPAEEVEAPVEEQAQPKMEPAEDPLARTDEFLVSFAELQEAASEAQPEDVPPLPEAFPVEQPLPNHDEAVLAPSPPQPGLATRESEAPLEQATLHPDDAQSDLELPPPQDAALALEGLSWQEVIEALALAQEPDDQKEAAQITPMADAAPTPQSAPPDGERDAMHVMPGAPPPPSTPDGPGQASPELSGSQEAAARDGGERPSAQGPATLTGAAIATPLPDPSAAAQDHPSDLAQAPLSGNGEASGDDTPASAPTTAVPRWYAAAEPQRDPRSTRRWGAASAVALTLLLLQGVHHFRAELAGQALVGPLLHAAYGYLGMPLAPNWNVEQYQIMDWVATAEPNASGRGALRIGARIHNKGPASQPYPHVRLELTDRWEATVGRRVFRPEEYSSERFERGDLMDAGETVQAVLEVVDPGPDAYGFELDVCIEGKANSLVCASDRVFQ